MYGQDYLSETLDNIGMANSYSIEVSKIDGKEGSDWTRDPLTEQTNQKKHRRSSLDEMAH